MMLLIFFSCALAFDTNQYLSLQSSLEREFVAIDSAFKQCMRSAGDYTMFGVVNKFVHYA